MGLFERYLTLWVGLAIVAGVILGNFAPEPFAYIAQLQYAQVNFVIAVYLGNDLPDDGTDRFFCR